MPIPTVGLDVGGLAGMLGGLLGITTESAGWLLGGLLSGVLLTVGLIIASKTESAGATPFFAFIALAFGLSTLFGWFPIWVIFFAFVFALMSVMGFLAAARSGA